MQSVFREKNTPRFIPRRVIADESADVLFPG
jgi:hypothetical protein